MKLDQNEMVATHWQNSSVSNVAYAKLWSSKWLAGTAATKKNVVEIQQSNLNTDWQMWSRW